MPIVLFSICSEYVKVKNSLEMKQMNKYDCQILRKR